MGRYDSLRGQRHQLTNIDEELALLELEEREAKFALKDLYRMVRRLFFACGCHRHGVIGTVYGAKEGVLMGRRFEAKQEVEAAAAA